MFESLGSAEVVVLQSIEELWRYCDSTQSGRYTPAGGPSEAEERLDLKMGEAIKRILEERIGPEEGAHPVQSQNWDWNDDRTRPVFVLRAAFAPEVVECLRASLNGEFSDLRVLLLLKDSWDSEVGAE